MDVAFTRLLCYAAGQSRYENTQNIADSCRATCCHMVSLQKTGVALRHYVDIAAIRQMSADATPMIRIYIELRAPLLPLPAAAAYGHIAGIT